MAVTKQNVMYALLALDAYNRHADDLKRKISEGGNEISAQVGDATWKESSDRKETESPSLTGSQAAGFSASSYTYNGDVISYRGTDFPSDWTSGSQLLEFAKDYGDVVDGARLRHLMCQDGSVVKQPNEGFTVTPHFTIGGYGNIGVCALHFRRNASLFVFK